MMTVVWNLAMFALSFLFTVASVAVVFDLYTPSPETVGIGAMLALATTASRARIDL